MFTKNGDVIKDTLLTVDLLLREFTTDLYVFDSIIVIRMNNGDWKFFERPLVDGQKALPIQIVSRNGVSVDTSLLAADFTTSKMEDTLEFYGVSQNKLHRYVFIHNSIENEMTLISYFVDVEALDGNIFRLDATSEFIVVSCANCDAPGVYFFNLEDMQFMKFFNMT